MADKLKAFTSQENAATGPIGQDIARLLFDALAPDYLLVRDDSAHHAGHMGAHPAGETHFHVTISAAALSGLTRVAAHRAVNTVLADHLAGHVHALQIEIKK